MKVNKKSQSNKKKSLKQIKASVNKKSSSGRKISFDKRSRVEMDRELLVPKSVENVSISVRNKAAKSPVGEMYKKRHNIGRRLAAERVGSYDEAEVLISYQDGYFSSGNTSTGSSTIKSASSVNCDKVPENNEKSSQSLSAGHESLMSTRGKRSSAAKLLKFDDDDDDDVGLAAVQASSSQSSGRKKVVGAGEISTDCSQKRIKAETIATPDSGGIVLAGKESPVKSNAKLTTPSKKLQPKQKADDTGEVSRSATSVSGTIVSLASKTGVKRELATVAHKKSYKSSAADATKLSALQRGRKRKSQEVKRLVSTWNKVIETSASERPKREACLNAGAFMSLMYVDKKLPRKSLLNDSKDSSDVTEFTSTLMSSREGSRKSPVKSDPVVPDRNLSLTKPIKITPSKKTAKVSKTYDEIADLRQKTSSHISSEKEYSVSEKQVISSAKSSSEEYDFATPATIKRQKSQQNARKRVADAVVESKDISASPNQVVKTKSPSDRSSKESVSNTCAKTSSADVVIASNSTGSLSSKKPSLEPDTPRRASSAGLARAKSLKSSGGVQGRVSLPLTRNRKLQIKKSSAKRAASLDSVETAQLPKRMASLNAQAILAASTDSWSRRSSLQRKNIFTASVTSLNISQPSCVSAGNAASLSTSLVDHSSQVSLMKPFDTPKCSQKDSAVVTTSTDMTVQFLSVSSRQATVLTPKATPKSKSTASKALDKSLKSNASPGAKFQTPSGRVSGVKGSSAGRSRSSQSKPSTPTPFTLLESPSTLLADTRIHFAGTCSEVPSPTPNKKLVEMRPVHGSRGTDSAAIATRLSYPVDSQTSTPVKKSRASAGAASADDERLSGSLWGGNSGETGSTESKNSKISDCGNVVRPTNNSNSEHSDGSRTDGKASNQNTSEKSICSKESFQQSSAASKEKSGRSGGKKSVSASSDCSIVSKVTAEKARSCRISPKSASNSAGGISAASTAGYTAAAAVGGVVAANAAALVTAAQANPSGSQSSTQLLGYYAAPLPAHSTYPPQPSSVRFNSQAGVVQQQYINQFYPTHNGFYSYQSTGATNGTTIGTVYPSIGNYPMGTYNFDPRYMTSNRAGVAADYRQMGYQQYPAQTRQYPTAVEGFRMYESGTCAAGTQFLPVVFQQPSGGDTTVQTFNSQKSSVLSSGSQAVDTGGLVLKTAAAGGAYTSVPVAAQASSQALSKSVAGQDRVSTRSDGTPQAGFHRVDGVEAQSKDCAVQVRSRGTVPRAADAATSSAVACAKVTLSAVTSASDKSVATSGVTVVTSGNVVDEMKNDGMTAVGLIPYQMGSGSQAYVIVASPSGGVAVTNSTGSSTSLSLQTAAGCVAMYPGSFVIHGGAAGGGGGNIGAVGGGSQGAGQYAAAFQNSFTVVQSQPSGLSTEDRPQAGGTTEFLSHRSARGSLAKILPKQSSDNAAQTLEPLRQQPGGQQSSGQQPVRQQAARQQAVKQLLPRGSSATALDQQTITIGPGQLIVETFQDKELDLSRKNASSPGTSSKSSDTLDLTRKKKKKSPKTQTSLQLPDVLMSTRQHAVPHILKHRLSNRSRHRMPALVPLPGASRGAVPLSSSADDLSLLSRADGSDMSVDVGVVSDRPVKRRRQRQEESSSDGSGVEESGVLLIDERCSEEPGGSSVPLIQIQSANHNEDNSTGLVSNGTGVIVGELCRVSTEPSLNRYKQLIEVTPNAKSTCGSPVNISSQSALRLFQSAFTSPPIRRSVSVGCDGTLTTLSLAARGTSPAIFSTSTTPPPVVQYGKKIPSPGNPGGDGNPKGSKGTKRKSDTEVEVVKKKSKSLQTSESGAGPSRVSVTSSKPGRPASLGSPRKDTPSGRKSDSDEGGRKQERSPQVGGGGGRKTEEGESGGKERKDKALLSRRTPDDLMKKLSTGKKREVGGASSQLRWSWSGEAELKPMFTQVDGPAVSTNCYQAVCHTDGDVIRVRDCVLIKSGMRKKDIPYVAKIYGFWESEGGEMMMGVLWYYRLEHTETQPLPRYINSEVFASRHRDVIPVACIEDRCYVLTLNEFNRYKAAMKRAESYGTADSASLVPAPAASPASPLPGPSSLLSGTPTSRLPPLHVDQETVFLCRHIYDIKLKRILKNPQIHVPTGNI